jgi:hypothetical protein
MSEKEVRCHDCEFSYSRLGNYCFRLELKCPHPLEENKK